MKKVGLATAVVGMVGAGAFAAPRLESGLKPGESMTPFQVVDVCGPNKGKQLCYVCKSGKRPVVMAFVKDDPARAVGLAAKIQKLNNTYRAKDLRTFVVFLGGAELKNSITRVAREQKISIPLTFLPEGANQGDIARYRVNPAARNTVLVYSEHRIRANFVNVDDASFPGVLKATADMLGK